MIRRFVLLFMSALLVVLLSLGLVCVEVLLSALPETAPPVLLAYEAATHAPTMPTTTAPPTPLDPMDLPVSCPPAVQLLLTFETSADVPAACPPPVALLLSWAAPEAPEGSSSPGAPEASTAPLAWTVSVEVIRARPYLVATVRALAAEVAPGRSFHTKTTKQPTKGLRRFLRTHTPTLSE